VAELWRTCVVISAGVAEMTRFPNALHGPRGDPEDLMGRRIDGAGGAGEWCCGGQFRIDCSQKRS